jgi:hypothetical protein
LRPDLPREARMPWIRSLAASLCEQGFVVITQRGAAMRCSGYKGPVRLALSEAGRIAVTI